MTKETTFELLKPPANSPHQKRVPILVSSPHSGVLFPEDLKPLFKPSVINHPQDTDWFVDELYAFVSSMGISFIQAKYSRYVVDLNRSPELKPIYTDGRAETSIVPLQTFLGETLYNEGNEPRLEQIQNRIKLYYEPYYEAIEETLKELLDEFGQVLFFDAHSIKDHVPSITKEPFPHLILGNNNQTSCAPFILEPAKKVLENSPWKLSINSPFKGGNLTRFFGCPKEGVHSLQLEMCQSLYMDEGQLIFNLKRAQDIQGKLKEMFEELILSLHQEIETHQVWLKETKI